MVDILCAGQLVADILVRPVDRVDFGTDTQRIQTIALANGGDALNAAIGLSRLGRGWRLPARSATTTGEISSPG